MTVDTQNLRELLENATPGPWCAPVLDDRQHRAQPAAAAVPGDLVAVAQARILDELKRQDEGEWQKLFWLVAKELKCLPSAFVTDNEHVIKAARAALAAKKPAENIREGYPYDNQDFEDLCREHGIWGTAESALCAVFWRAANKEEA